MSEREKRNGPWTVRSTTDVYENPWIKVEHHEVVHPTGKPGVYGVVRFKNRAIGVLAIDANGMAPLVGQHRFPHDAFSWEAPEGGGRPEEDPLEAAKRELVEETGCLAAHWLEIARFDLSNSVTDEKAICFLAWGLSDGVPAPDDSEALSHDRISFSALHDRVLAGEISDSLTIIMVLKAAAMARIGRLPNEVARLILPPAPHGAMS